MRLSLALWVLVVCACIYTVDGWWRRMPTNRKPKGCPSGWDQHGKSCYRFISTAKIFKEATDDCIKHQGFLADITSESENNYLRHRARKLGMSVWVGAIGTYEWIKGKKSIKFSDWQKGEPNGNKEPCVELRKDFDYKWNDVPCLKRNAYICEKYL